KKRRSLKIVIMRELFNLKTNIKRRIYNLFH
ncbi:TPA: UDP-glucose--lipooligosaccharide glucosyltransferase, partial [Haemophilus influenzae]